MAEFNVNNIFEGVTKTQEKLFRRLNSHWSRAQTPSGLESPVNLTLAKSDPCPICRLRSIYRYFSAFRLCSLLTIAEAADLLQDIYARLEEMDASTAEPRAAEILHGLGFTPTMQRAPVSTHHKSSSYVLRFHVPVCLFVAYR